MSDHGVGLACRRTLAGFRKDEASSRPMLDVLLYAHDGRGLGHISRTIAIALAIKRLKPGIRVAVLTGSEHFAALACSANLECVKLPSYASAFSNGAAAGATGSSGMSHGELVAVRGAMSSAVLRILHPRAVLVDHYPRGKESELSGAIEESSPDTRWILGLRAEVGLGSPIWSNQSRELVHRRYCKILWYGDSRAIDRREFVRITEHFPRVQVMETGYVSRATELDVLGLVPKASRVGAVAAFPWRSEQTDAIGEALSEAGELAPDLGDWLLFLGRSSSQHATVPSWPRARVSHETRLVDSSFLSHLRSSHLALVLGGYNSLTDVMWSGVPAVAVTRSTTDQEQVRHTAALRPALPGHVVILDEAEATDSRVLLRAFEKVMKHGPTTACPIGLRGAEAAARIVMSILDAGSGN